MRVTSLSKLDALLLCELAAIFLPKECTLHNPLVSLPAFAANSLTKALTGKLATTEKD